MTDAERGDQATPAQTVGARLRAAREAQGLSLAEIAARTRVPLRHLEAIEVGDFSRLPSATYAVGFVRGYARAIGADEVTLAADTRDEVAKTVRARPQYEPYEIADPARVPSRTVAIVAAGLGIAVLVLALLWFATRAMRDEAAPAPAPSIAASAPVPAAAPTPPAASGQVTLTATDEVWLRVYDAANATLFLGTMKPGDRFDVPRDANNPMINVGRPDKLTVTLNGSAVAPLGSGERAIKDVPVSAAAIAARAAGQPAPAPAPGVTAAPPPAAAVPSRTGAATRTVPRAFRDAAPAPAARTSAGDVTAPPAATPPPAAAPAAEAPAASAAPAP